MLLSYTLFESWSELWKHLYSLEPISSSVCLPFMTLNVACLTTFKDLGIQAPNYSSEQELGSSAIPWAPW